MSRPDVCANLVSCLGMFRGFEVPWSILINKEITIGPSSPATESLTYGLGSYKHGICHQGVLLRPQLVLLFSALKQLQETAQ